MPAWGIQSYGASLLYYGLYLAPAPTNRPGCIIWTVFTSQSMGTVTLFLCVPSRAKRRAKP